MSQSTPLQPFSLEAHDNFQLTNGEQHERQLSFGFLPTSPVIHAAAHDFNTTQKLITVTEDKALICFNRNLLRMGKRRWLNPLSLLISLLLALATSEFNKLDWVSSHLLKAVFIVSSVVTTGWFVWELMHAGQLKDVPEVVQSIFQDLRGQSSELYSNVRARETFRF